MEKEYELLVDNFKRISKKGWLRSTSSSFGNIGNLFEQELGKSADSTYFPDYFGIELKCISRYSRYPLFLFTVAFDGPTFPEIDRIVAKYGWPDKDYPDKKVLFTRLFYGEKVLVNDDYMFSLQLDDDEQKLYLCVYDLGNNLIEKESFIYVDTLYNHLCLKLEKLAVIYASMKKLGDIKYYRYYKIEIYKLISFERFIELLKLNELDISLVCRLSKSGNDAGRQRSKNVEFAIKKYKIENLFTKTFSYDSDQHHF